MKKLRYLLLISMLWAVNAWAEPSVSRSQLTSGIEAREPVDDLGSTVTGASTDITTLYYFTELSDAANQVIEHRWLFEGAEKANVSFSIGGSRWRTYSSKRIRSDWQGSWEVQVWLDGTLLDSHSFTFNL